MKKLIIPLSMLFIVSAQANIEYDGVDAQPTTQEVTKNRACFEELAKNGCGDPGEDVKQVRSCLKNVFPTLAVDCKKLMNYLYSAGK